MKLGMADHLWKENGPYQSMWNKVKRKPHWEIGLIKESTYLSPSL